MMYSQTLLLLGQFTHRDMVLWVERGENTWRQNLPLTLDPTPCHHDMEILEQCRNIIFCTIMSGWNGELDATQAYREQSRCRILFHNMSAGMSLCCEVKLP